MQLKKEHSSGRLLMSDPESVAALSDKFIVKAKFIVDYLKHLEVMKFKNKKRAEQRARESQKIKENVYADDAWKYLGEDSTKLKQLRLLELKYLKHHGLHQHIKSPKNDKVKVIARHWLLQMNPEGPDPLMLQTRLGERDGADKDPYETVTAMKMSTAEVKAMIMIRTTMIPSTLGVKMSSLPLSMTRKKLRGQQRHALEDP